MSRSGKIKIAITGIALTVAFSVVFVFYFEALFTSTQPGESTAVHTFIATEAIYNTIVKGQSIHFSKGALICDDLQSIKNYFIYLNASRVRRTMGISRLFIRGLCGYSTTPRADADVLDVEGLFVKVSWVDKSESSTAWIIHTELFE